jgi:hypothetical protein
MGSDALPVRLEHLTARNRIKNSELQVPRIHVLPTKDTFQLAIPFDQGWNMFWHSQLS